MNFFPRRALFLALARSAEAEKVKEECLILVCRVKLHRSRKPRPHFSHTNGITPGNNDNKDLMIKGIHNPSQETTIMIMIIIMDVFCSARFPNSIIFKRKVQFSVIVV